MKIINSESELLKEIQEFKVNVKEKPLMIWCASNELLDNLKSLLLEDVAIAIIQDHPPKQSHTSVIIERKVEKISDHQDLLEKTLYPSTYSPQTQMFLYHRYLMQMEEEQLRYCIELQRDLSKPVLCLVNDYEKENKPQFVDDSFLQIEYSFYNTKV